MIIFRITVTVLILLIQVYLFRRFMHAAGADRSRKTRTAIVAGTFIAFNLPVLVLFFWRPSLSEWPAWAIITFVYPFYIWHFISFLIALGLGIFRVGALLVAGSRMVVRWLQRLTAVRPASPPLSRPQFDAKRRELFRHGFTILAGATVAGTTYSALRRGSYDITDIRIPVKGLPQAFHGFTIALVSDIHSSPFMTRSQMEDYVRGVNSIKADLIAIPGDLVNSEVNEAYPFAEAFSELRAPYGVYGTLGNHDFFTRNPDLVTRVISDCGVHILRNDRVDIAKAGQHLIIAGIDDTGTKERADRLIEGVLQGSTPSTPRILLCHRPYFFENASNHGVDLTLSGHTHGGQVVFARMGRSVLAPARIASPYVAGLYAIGDAKMYVSRGIGTVGVPFRVNCPPEITRIRLSPA